jgi:hypothetical protein
MNLMILARIIQYSTQTEPLNCFIGRNIRTILLILFINGRMGHAPGALPEGEFIRNVSTDRLRPRRVEESISPGKARREKRAKATS